MRKILVLRGHAKALFNETVDADSCGRTWKEICFSQLVRTGLVYLAGFEIWRPGIQIGLNTRSHHFFSLLPFSVSFFFKKSNSSSAVTFLSITVRKAKAKFGSFKVIRFMSSIGALTSN